MDSSDDECDWDEVEIPRLPPGQLQSELVDVALIEVESHPQLEHDIEVTITKTGGTNKSQQEEAARKRLVAAQNRLIRLESHKIHAVTLLASLSIRNQWLNDEVLKSRVLSLIPLPIQHGFTSITRSAHPDPARRGRLFEAALSRLVDWFAPSSSFGVQNSFVGRSEGWFHVNNVGHIRPHTFEAASLRAQVLETRETERHTRRAKREERRARRALVAVKGKGKARDLSSSDEDEEHDEDEENEWYAPETLRSANSIGKHALQRSGSRDAAALVFVAMARAMGLPTRLVGSLQCVSWSLPKDHWDKRTRGKKGDARKVSAGLGQTTAEDQVDMEEVAVPALLSSRIVTTGAHRGISLLPNGTSSRSERRSGSVSTPLGSTPKRKRSTLAEGDGTMTPDNKKPRRDATGPAEGSKRGSNKASKGSPIPPTIKLRKARPAGNVLGATPARSCEPGIGSRETIVDAPPTLWAEVFSRPDGRWLPVDPVRGIVNRARIFEEQSRPENKGANKLVYVVAIEEDGYARDVTARYAKNFAAKTAKARARVAAGGKGAKVEWWDSVMRMVCRPYPLHRDDVEDAELSHQLALEGLPTSVGAFKNHPIYALERHLHKDEAIFPRTEIAHFRGEPVFPRRNVLSLKSADGWMRQGRLVRAGMQPIKQGKARASTVRKKRELEMRREQEGEVTIGMYAYWQTDLHIPPPVVDGEIPTNGFGNIDLYVPTMLPAGAVHIPIKGCAKVARKLGIHFAEAVTGFEFRKRQATPIITGIVIAAENEQMFLEALASYKRAEEIKEAAKRRERVLKRWSRLVQGLRIVQRVNEQYSNAKQERTSGGDIGANMDHAGSEEPGGFLDDLRDVVKPYHLPEVQHLVPRLATDDGGDTVLVSGPAGSDLLSHKDMHGDSHNTLSNGPAEEVNYGAEETSGLPQEYIPPLESPLTMQQLADQSKAQAEETTEDPGLDNSETPSPPLIRPVTRQQVRVKKPRITRSISRPSTSLMQDTVEKTGSEGDPDDSEYTKDTEPGRPTHTSRSKRHILPEVESNSPSVSTRILRPRRK